jgi:hypothetical protein
MSALMPVVVLAISAYEKVHQKMMLVSESFLIRVKPKTKHPFQMNSRITQVQVDMAKKLVEASRFKPTINFLLLTLLPTFILKLLKN